MKRVLIAMAVAAVALVNAQTQEKKFVEPESFKEAKQLVGGVWRGEVGPKLPVELRFTLTDSKRVIDSNGIVGDPKKPVLKMHSRIGVDSATGKTYYVDTHNADTIYFGHVDLKEGKMIFDFNGLSGDPGHYIAREQIIGKDHFESVLYGVDDSGKETELHKLVLDRKSK